MAEENQQSTLVNVKRVREESGKGKAGDQDQIVLTFGPDKQGNNGLLDLVSTLTEYANAGKQVNFDIRLATKQTERGSSFRTAFVLIREMVPRDQQRDTKSTYTPKTSSRQQQIKAQASKFANGIE